MKPTNYLLLLLCCFSTLTGSISSLKAQAPKNPMVYGCDHFRQGLFIYAEEPYTGIKVRRKRRKQITTNPQTGEIQKFKIKWVDNCEYHLTFKKSNMPTKLRKGWVLEVKVKETYEDYYKFESSRFGIKTRGTLQKIMSEREKRQVAREKEEEEEELAKKEERIAVAEVGEEEEEYDEFSKKSVKKRNKKSKKKKNKEEKGGKKKKTKKPKKTKQQKAKEKIRKKEERGSEKPTKKEKSKKPKKKKEKEKKEKPEKKKKDKKSKKKEDE